MKIIKFCDVSGEKLILCNGMSEVLESSDGRGTRYQGIKLQTLINMKTGKFSRYLILVKSGKHAKRGLVFNFCPFCRTELLEGCEKEWSRHPEKTEAPPVSSQQDHTTTNGAKNA